jgi:hypothetical protein
MGKKKKASEGFFSKLKTFLGNVWKEFKTLLGFEK